PPSSPLFPYTTLFRSFMASTNIGVRIQSARPSRLTPSGAGPAGAAAAGPARPTIAARTAIVPDHLMRMLSPRGGVWTPPSFAIRSEEHTSELQSRSDL